MSSHPDYCNFLFRSLSSFNLGKLQCIENTLATIAVIYTHEHVADDIVIITPSQTAMRLQLEICDKFSSGYSIYFNPDKYQLLHYTHSSVMKGMFFNGIIIKSAKSANHLGITLNIDDKGSCVKNITDMFFVNVNSLKASFSNVSRAIK